MFFLVFKKKNLTQSYIKTRVVSFKRDNLYLMSHLLYRFIKSKPLHLHARFIFLFSLRQSFFSDNLCHKTVRYLMPLIVITKLFKKTKVLSYLYFTSNLFQTFSCCRFFKSLSFIYSTARKKPKESACKGNFFSASKTIDRAAILSLGRFHFSLKTNPSGKISESLRTMRGWFIFLHPL